MVVFSTTKTDRHDITEILLEVALNTTTPPINYLRIDLNLFSVHEEINSKMWYTLCNPRSGLRKGVYHNFEFISNEPKKKL